METAAAPAEKVGWQSFAQQGASTGGGFMQQGAGTASAFMTDPNFDFAKEGDKYKASGAPTHTALGAPPRPAAAPACPAPAPRCAAAAPGTATRPPRRPPGPAGRRSRART